MEFDLNATEYENRYRANPDYYGELSSTMFKVVKEDLRNYFNKRKKYNIKIVEIGGGQGRDAIALTKLFPAGVVITSDLAPSAIRIVEKKVTELKLKNRISIFTQNIFSQYRTEFSNSDLLYANMCLHYHKKYTKPQKLYTETIRTFQYASETILPKGLFVFSVYSDQSPDYQKGEQILDNIDIYRFRGKIKHFFTPQFIQEILEKNGCKILKIKSVKEDYDPNTPELEYYYIVIAEKL